MDDLGGFRPTVTPVYRELKGMKYDGDGGHKTYLDANTLRLMAEHMVIVADWLDAAALAAAASGQGE